MTKVSERLNRLSESQTLAMARLSRELTAQGIDVISLSLGEPDFNTPDHVKAAAKKAIEDNVTHYPPIAGFLELRKAVSEKFKRENDLDYSPEQIVVSTGAKQSIANVVMALVDKGDEVILLSPYWVSYLEIVKLAEGTPVLVKAGIENDFKVSAEQIEKAITPKTKMIIFSSPCNPTGSVFSQKELEAIADVVAKHENIIVLSDEIYEHINFSGKSYSIGRCKNIQDRVVTINGLSKAYAMTGWRLGFIGAPLWIAKACDKMQGQITSGTSTISQMAAIAALNSPPTITEDMTKEFHKRRDLCFTLLSEIPGLKCNKPEGAFYFFPEISSYFGKSYQGKRISNAEELCMFLLHEGHVATVSGDAFGEPNCIRLSYATSEENLRKAMQRMKDTLAKLG
jgi:aspartate aminotransferase